ncbi:hypothetical protein [Microbacterium terregens]|uniref:Uncharacterized protein n=1 Tax=Microbacterium terregens TaxID=69363 RepID=A0ABV5SYK1_9MICO
MKAEQVATLVVLIAGIVIVVALVATLVFVISKRRTEGLRIEGLAPAERAAHDAAVAAAARFKEAQRELTLARKEYDQSVKAAEKALSRGQKEHQAAIKSAQRTLADAHAIGARSIGVVAGREGRISATETTVTVPQGVFPIDGVTASVDTAGNFATSSRTTVTRVAAGAVVFGPVGALVGATAKKTKAHDLRELYLLVEGPGFAAVVTCNPDHGSQVRQFAAAVNSAAPNVNAVLAYRAQSVAVAEVQLKTVTADTTTPDRLSAELATVRHQTLRIRAAEQRLALESPTLSSEVPPEGLEHE